VGKIGGVLGEREEERKWNKLKALSNKFLNQRKELNKE